MHNDKTGVTIADKSSVHAVKTFDKEGMSVRIMLGSMLIELSVAEIDNLHKFVMIEDSKC